MAAQVATKAPQLVALQNKDRVIAAVLTILGNEKIGALRNMFAKYSQNGAQFVFKTPERLIPAHYTAVGGNKSQFGTVGEIIITPDQREIIKFPIETLDWVTEDLAEEEIQRIAASIVMAIDAQLDAEVLTGLVKAAGTNTVKYIAGLTSKGPSETMTDAEIKAIWRRLNFTGNELKGKVTKNTIGTSAGQSFHLVSNNLLSLLVETAKVFTDKTVEIFMEGSQTTALRVGTQTIVGHVFLGQTFPAGSLHEKKAYDFSKVHCLSLHSESFALAFNSVPSMVEAIDPDSGNPVMITKYQYGMGAIRPAFIIENGIAKDATDYGTIGATDTGAVISANIATINPSTKA